MSNKNSIFNAPYLAARLNPVKIQSVLEAINEAEEAGGHVYIMEKEDSEFIINSDPFFDDDVSQAYTHTVKPNLLKIYFDDIEDLNRDIKIRATNPYSFFSIHKIYNKISSYYDEVFSKEVETTEFCMLYGEVTVGEANLE